MGRLLLSATDPCLVCMDTRPGARVTATSQSRPGQDTLCLKCVGWYVGIALDAMSGLGAS